MLACQIRITILSPSLLTQNIKFFWVSIPSVLFWLRLDVHLSFYVNRIIEKFLFFAFYGNDAIYKEEEYHISSVSNSVEVATWFLNSCFPTIPAEYNIKTTRVSQVVDSGKPEGDIRCETLDQVVDFNRDCRDQKDYQEYRDRRLCNLVNVFNGPFLNYTAEEKEKYILKSLIMSACFLNL